MTGVNESTAPPGSSEAADDAFDALRARFRTPPAEFGPVPFWWWVSEKLDRDRIAWQLDQTIRVEPRSGSFGADPILEPVLRERDPGLMPTDDWCSNWAMSARRRR